MKIELDQAKVSLATHRFVGMYRPPLVIPDEGDVQCPCGELLSVYDALGSTACLSQSTGGGTDGQYFYHQSAWAKVREHWLAGHFDVPQWEELPGEPEPIAWLPYPSFSFESWLPNWGPEPGRRVPELVKDVHAATVAEAERILRADRLAGGKSNTWGAAYSQVEAAPCDLSASIVDEASAALRDNAVVQVPIPVPHGQADPNEALEGLALERQFRDLSPGDHFSYGESRYMKLHSRFASGVNAQRVVDGEQSFFGPDTPVTRDAAQKGSMILDKVDELKRKSDAYFREHPEGTYVEVPLKSGGEVIGTASIPRPDRDAYDDARKYREVVAALGELMVMSFRDHQDVLAAARKPYKRNLLELMAAVDPESTVDHSELQEVVDLAVATRLKVDELQRRANTNAAMTRERTVQG